jgi:hypothetical protein
MESDCYGIQFYPRRPYLRIFDIAKADEFLSGVGFSVDWTIASSRMLHFIVRFHAAI